MVAIVGGLTPERASSLSWLKVKVESTFVYTQKGHSLHNNFQEPDQKLKQERLHLIYELRRKKTILINQAKLLNRK